MEGALRLGVEAGEPDGADTGYKGDEAWRAREGGSAECGGQMGGGRGEGRLAQEGQVGAGVAEVEEVVKAEGG